MTSGAARAKTGRFSLRKHRLGRSDFERIFRDGARARSELLTVVVLENGLAHSRLGLSVGKRVSKRAVDRNRVRRVLREAFRLSRADLPVGIDVVLIAPPGAKRPALARMRSELVVLCARACSRLRPRPEASPRSGAPAP
jgi:ribonuclease P protein component